MPGPGMFQFLRRWFGGQAGLDMGERNSVFQIVSADPPVGDRRPGDVWYHTGAAEWRCWDGSSIQQFKGAAPGPGGSFSFVAIPAGPLPPATQIVSGETIVVDTTAATVPGYQILMPIAPSLGDVVNIINHAGLGAQPLDLVGGAALVVGDPRSAPPIPAPTAPVTANASLEYVFYDVATAGADIWFLRASS